MRPPPIEIDESIYHHDIDNEEVRAVYPGLPRSKSCSDLNEMSRRRNEFIHKQDMKAYKKIASRFPQFTPPSYTVSKQPSSDRFRYIKLWVWAAWSSKKKVSSK